MKSKQIKSKVQQVQFSGRLTKQQDDNFDKKIEQVYGKGNYKTKVLRKLIVKFTNGEIKL